MPKTTNSQVFNKKPSQRAILLNALLAGKRLTQDDFVKMTGNNFAKIAARKYDLLQKGYPVEGDDIPLDDGTYFTEYYLPEWFLTYVKKFGLDRALEIATNSTQVTKLAKKAVQNG